MANTTTPGFGGAWSPLSRIRRQSFIPAERQVIYIVYPIMIAAFTWAQVTLATAFLAHG